MFTPQKDSLRLIINLNNMTDEASNFNRDGFRPEEGETQLEKTTLLSKSMNGNVTVYTMRVEGPNLGIDGCIATIECGEGWQRFQGHMPSNLSRLQMRESAIARMLRTIADSSKVE